LEHLLLQRRLFGQNLLWYASEIRVVHFLWKRTLWKREQIGHTNLREFRFQIRLRNLSFKLLFELLRLLQLELYGCQSVLCLNRPCFECCLGTSAQRQSSLLRTSTTRTGAAFAAKACEQHSTFWISTATVSPLRQQAVTPFSECPSSA